MHYRNVGVLYEYILNLYKELLVSFNQGIRDGRGV